MRRIQENPALGALRVRAALARIGIHLGTRTVGRMLAVNRRVYGLEKPKGPAEEKREMPFRAERRHQLAQKPRRRRLAEDPAAGRLHPEETPARIVAAGTFPLPRSLGMNFS